MAARSGPSLLPGSNAGEIAPGAKGVVSSSTVSSGSEAITAKLEVVVDPAMGGRESLCMARRLEPLHLPLSSSRGLVRHLSPVVQVPALPVLNARQDLALGGAVAAQLVGHDDPEHRLQGPQQHAEEALGRSGISPALHEDVEHVAVLVDRTPEIVQLAPNALKRRRPRPGDKWHMDEVFIRIRLAVSLLQPEPA